MNNIKPPAITASGTESIEKLFGDFSFSKITDDIVSGKFSPDPQGVLNRIIHIFMGELSQSFVLMGALASLLVMCAFLENLQSSFENKSTSAAVNYALFVYLAAINAAAFEKACAYVSTTVRDITVLMQGIIPAMALAGASGGSVYAGAIHPLIFFICSVFALLLKNVITPLVLLRAAASLLGGISQNGAMGEFADIFSKLHKMLLAFTMSIFAGVLTVGRFAAASFDSLYARGIKFAITSAVPVVGGSISEAMSTVAGSALALKSAVGIAGVVMLFAVFFVPMIKLGALCAVYRITAAIAAPVTDKRVISAIKTTGECVDMLFTSIACMGIIMVIAIASII